MKRILVVAAHCDDETYGCGGLIWRTHQDGGHVCVLVASHNETTGAEFRMACGGLGVRSCVMLGLPTLGLQNYIPVMADAVRNIIFDQSTDEVYTHAHDDTHQDHEAVSRATMIGAGPGSRARVVAEYEAPLSSVRVAPFWPNLFQAIDIEKKCEALEKYKSQVLPAPHPRALETVRALARVRGSQGGVEYAEGFRIVRSRQ